ncbi:MAG: 2,4-dihydroxyhept-2-ene-1,7-dioic acid aldolase [Dehalococcoidia bacterium]|nr:2,4-dihydroxyhept-2-ene-1,7-dioic acid aldolase [Dehalococcoidia bacterium]
MRPNHVLRNWRNGGQTVGAWLSINSSFTAEAMAHSGFDWLCIDMQHGVIDYSDAMPMLQAISTTDTVPFVRVPWNDPAIIMRVLDAGAYGVVVPLVNNREEAERAVWAVRYPPAGGRSSGPARAAMYGGSDYQTHANDEMACIVMIETAEAIEKLDEILAVPGVDAAYIGPSDLAYAIGLPPTGDNNEPKHVETVDRIFEACKRHGVAPGIHTGSVEYTSRYLKQGFQMVTLSADVGFMRRQVNSDLAAARGSANVAPAPVEA